MTSTPCRQWGTASRDGIRKARDARSSDTPLHSPPIPRRLPRARSPTRHQRPMMPEFLDSFLRHAAHPRHVEKRGKQQRRCRPSLVTCHLSPIAAANADADATGGPGRRHCVSIVLCTHRKGPERRHSPTYWQFTTKLSRARNRAPRNAGGRVVGHFVCNARCVQSRGSNHALFLRDRGILRAGRRADWSPASAIETELVEPFSPPSTGTRRMSGCSWRPCSSLVDIQNTVPSLTPLASTGTQLTTPALCTRATVCHAPCPEQSRARGVVRLVRTLRTLCNAPVPTRIRVTGSLPQLLLPEPFLVPCGPWPCSACARESEPESRPSPVSRSMIGDSALTGPWDFSTAALPTATMASVFFRGQPAPLCAISHAGNRFGF